MLEIVLRKAEGMRLNWLKLGVAVMKKLFKRILSNGLVRSMLLSV